jgi:hypothetical protein
MSSESGIQEIPQILRGKLPDNRLSSIGSGSLANRAKAVVLGGGYDNDDVIASMREAASKAANIPWVRQDTSKPTPPLGPEYGKAMVGRVKEALGELQKSGKLDGSEGGVFWY